MGEFEESKITNKDLLYPELSYEVQGAVYAVSNSYGIGFKEKIYQNALTEELAKRKIPFTQQQRINIYSLESGKILGTYIPDFVIDDKIILEIKASDFTTGNDLRQQQSYLRASKYEIGYLVNFCTEKLFVKRFICTNDRKPFFLKIATNP